MRAFAVVKKNAEVVVCLWIGKRTREGLAPLNPELRSAFAAAIGSETSRTFEPTGTGADGLWLRACLWPGGAERAGALWI